jgi:hypothetical protein
MIICLTIQQTRSINIYFKIYGNLALGNHGQFYTGTHFYVGSHVGKM